MHSMMSLSTFGRTVTRVAAGLALFAALGIGNVRGQIPGIPEEFTNLKFFPDSISQRELVGVMRSFAFGLGVRCEFCHVGEPGQPLSTFDFAADEKPTKEKARAMLQMVADINTVYLAELSERSEPAIEVNCSTCHHGVSKPAPTQDVVVAKVAEEGTEAGIAEYHRLRDEYYGTFSYDFSESVLTDVAERVTPDRGSDAALAFLELNAELFPESLGTQIAMARTHQAAGNNEAAIAALERALELAPGNPRIQQMLDRIRN